MEALPLAKVSYCDWQRQRESLQAQVPSSQIFTEPGEFYLNGSGVGVHFLDFSVISGA
jgi:hypothetical protein